MGFARFAVATLAAVASLSSWAQTTPYQEYDKLVKSAEMVTPLKSDLFGDNVSLYNGATEFTVFDISLPGNDALPVRLGRTFKVELRNDADSLGGFGAWDLEVPYMHGVFPATYKWNTGGNLATDRCSQPFYPRVDAPFYQHEVWSGTKVHIPGKGDQSVLWNGNSGNAQPTDGAAYYWNTRDQMRFKCTAMLNYPGQGFVAVDSQGTQYFFNYAIERAGGVTRKAASGWGEVAMARTKIHLMATRVQDRFGNHVSYEYSGDQLSRIVSSDGRIITLTYSDGRIVKASAHGREWNYSYHGSLYFGGFSRARALTAVTLPDQSRWQYQYNGVLSLAGTIQDGSTGDARCVEPLPDNASFGFTATHPAGAIGTFQFDYRRHGVSGTPANACVLEGVINNVQHWALVIPDYYYNFALDTKTIAGPGVASQQWRYLYGDPLTGRSNYAGLYCTTCDQEKTVLVVQPDGSKEEYVFGVLFNFNDGRLLGKYVRRSDDVILRAELNDYVSESEAPSMPFPNEFGYLSGAHDVSTVYNRPIRKVTILQDGDIAGPVEYVPTTTPPTTPPPINPGDPGPPVCEPQPPTYTCDQPMSVPGSPMMMSTAGTSSGVSATAFVRQVNTFDAHARPLSVTLSNAVAGSVARTELTTYHDNPARWVMGQTAKLTVNGMVVSESTFDGFARPTTYKSFGKLRQTLAYNADGTIATFKDGNNNVTTVSGWKRGIPQSIKHPATAEAPTGAVESAVVNDSGWITSVTDENGYRTCYAHDAMGRISQVTYPSESVANSCNTTTWVATTQVFQPVAVAEYGIPAGHWRQTVSTGNARKITYFDALWRPLVTKELDATNATTETLTKRFQRFDYDHEGRVTFASYPGTTDALSTGTWTTYDALGRQRSVSVDSELSPSLLTTTTSYLNNSAGPYTLVTTPAGQQTRTWFQMFDQPDYSRPVRITHPETAATHIARDVFGKPTRIRRSNSTSATGGSLAINRDYAYNDHQELCLSVEPETGATVMGYDGAGNLTWSASGLPAATACHTTGNTTAINARKAVRAYDARNRITSLSFPDGLGNTIHTYYPDGLPENITAHNGGSNIVNTEYTYNRRRLLTKERMLWGSVDWPLVYNYNANGHLLSQVLPGGLTVGYVPNALGQPTQAGTYATGVSYYPNGSIKQFTYGNGVVHNLIQNARQLPERSYDCAVAGTGCTSTNKRLDLSYAYDTVGNVSGVTDNRNGRQTRSMAYDGLDRLTQTISPMFGTASYTYNALDNLTSVNVTAGTSNRTHTYAYNPANQLSNIKNTDGETVVALDYDPQGNLDFRTGQGATLDPEFDFGNRLRSVTGKASYVYDGLGRRVRDYTTASKYSMYSQAGQLVYASDLRQGLATQYIYLGGSLVALRERPTGSSTAPIKYQHTDALGTPIAVTDASKTIVETFEYEPYGQLVNSTLKDGPGYTGHVQDAATGLTYMQQRYYDPQVGMFLSVDPVTAYSNPVGMFNRYRYANSNPYRFTDPDGRAVETPWDAINVGLGVASLVRNVATGNYAGAALDAVGVAYDSVATAVPGLPGGAGTLIKVGRGVDAVADTARAASKVDNSSSSAGKLYHYTNEAGAKGIAESGVIKPDAKGRVYLTTDKVSPDQASNALFMGRGGDKGTHVVEVDMRQGAGLRGGEQPNELIHQGAVRSGRQADLEVKKNEF